MGGYQAYTGNGWPNYTGWVDNTWGSGQAGECAGAPWWATAVAGLQLGGNPAYTLDNVLAFSPKFFGPATQLVGCTVVAGSPSVVVPTVAGLAAGHDGGPRSSQRETFDCNRAATLLCPQAGTPVRGPTGTRQTAVVVRATEGLRLAEGYEQVADASVWRLHNGHAGDVVVRTAALSEIVWRVRRSSGYAAFFGGAEQSGRGVGVGAPQRSEGFEV